MKRFLLTVCLVLFAADLALAQAGSVCLFADPQGSNCTISDPFPGLIQVYVVHTQASNVKAVEFMAPVPACMSNAVYLGEISPWPLVIGNSQTGVSIGYPTCLTSPIHVLTINIFGTGASLPDCPYQVLPHPQAGVIAVMDCDDHPLAATGGTTFVNSSLACVCGANLPPLLNVNPTTLDYGATTTHKSFVIGNAGGGVLTWEVMENVPWLDATPTSGTGWGSVTVAVDRSGLAAGSYSGLIAVTSSGGNETVTVNMQVPLPSPVLGVSPASLTFGATESDKTLTVFNAGTGDLDWTITSDRTWLTANPVSGTNDTPVAVHVDRSGLADGSYTGSLLVASNGGDGSVPVEMIVNTQPILSVNPTTLGFSPAVTTRTFSIANIGFGTLEWSLSADPSWIEIVPPLSGSGNATVTVQVDPSSVPSGGTQIGHVTVASNGGTKLVEVRYVTNGPATGGSIGVFADPTGSTCNILDNHAGLLKVYVVHLNTTGATAVQVAAPRPACMTGASWLADENVFPVVVGNSQIGVSVGYGACLASPIHVLTIDYFASGLGEVCCPYPVIADPGVPSGKIEVSDCNFNVVFANGGTSIVNPDGSCHCGAIRVQETTWGNVKALYAPE